MRLRRCAILMIEPVERLEFDLSLLSGGGSGLRTVVDWVAIAPHLGKDVVLSTAEVALLGALSPSRWTDREELTAAHPCEVLDALFDKHLLVSESTAAGARDQALRDTNWRTASAVMHYASRWRGVDTEAVEQQFAETAEGSLLDRLGAAPPVVRERVPASERQRLPAVESTPLDALLDRRVTCRNFDASRNLTAAQFSSVLYRAFGARAVNDYAPGVQLLKKGVPSAGGLHATEAYLLVQRVDGVTPGLYHYHPVDHALEPIRMLTADEAAATARRFVAAQAYFVDAHVIVLPTSRFLRNFWKYRNHAKAYRALILDVGHLSQTMYLAATELGLAAFITAAINEVDIEQAFGLDPLEEGPLAVCGFGLRGHDRSEVEFDPLNTVWPAA
ncbi:putative peptide maturation dehydrogenase [Dokdonella soli]|uniref:Peptide maturation dehydrogenase n=1 Tax=Dokdonella soli TaxID=529810 RepID=A0ABN1IFT3_9GAMM